MHPLRPLDASRVGLGQHPRPQLLQTDPDIPNNHQNPQTQPATDIVIMRSAASMAAVHQLQQWATQHSLVLLCSVLQHRRLAPNS